LTIFAAVVDTVGTAFLIEGRYIKSVNRWYNKQKARLQSIYSKQNIKYGKKLARICLRRQHIIDNFLNQAVNYIIKHCLNNQIGTVVIGEMKDIKQKINLGVVNNQNFVNIPYERFKRKLEAKCEYYGLEYVEVDESYTSQRLTGVGQSRKVTGSTEGYTCAEIVGM